MKFHYDYITLEYLFDIHQMCIDIRFGQSMSKLWSDDFDSLSVSTANLQELVLYVCYGVFPFF